MANRYWVGGSGTITSASTANWSTTSGGPGGASFPTVNDIALFDANSGGGVITFSSTSLILSGFDARGFTGTFTCDATAGGISIRKSGNVYLRSTLNNALAPSFGVYVQPIEVNVNVTIDVAEGAYWPCDYLAGSSNSNCTVSIVGGPLTCRRLIMQSPTNGFGNYLNTSGNNIIALVENANINVFGVDIQAGVSGVFGTSTLIAQRMRLLNNTIASNATLRIKDRLFISSGFVCKDLEIDAVSGVDCTIEARMTATRISNINKNVPFRLILPNITGGNSLTVTDFDISGSESAIVDIRAGASAQYAQLIKTNSSKTENLDYLRFYYINGSPSADTWYVGSHSTNVGGIPTGLIFADNFTGQSSQFKTNLFFAAL